ncbi:MAG TPA: class I SAM-dependent methyltransferase, partial [Acidimicrobiales bacterium]|nr:class I SAM-dependent methyltransferase [Acidimicrobiales bacterium]
DSLVRPAAVEHQRKRWTRLADTWEFQGAAGLSKVVEAVLDEARFDENTVAVDLGSGTGQLSLPLAKKVSKVWAVDISQAMLDLLIDNAKSDGLENIETMAASIESIDFPAESLDLIVTNYVFHHLLDTDKERIVRKSAKWLKPGGQLVIGDMMFGRGADSRDREIIRSKVVALAKKGPAGWWRIAKNLWRFSVRVQERPVRIDVWESFLQSAGYADITSRPIVEEAAVVSGTKPLQKTTNN